MVISRPANLHEAGVLRVILNEQNLASHACDK